MCTSCPGSNAALENTAHALLGPEKELQGQDMPDLTSKGQLNSVALPLCQDAGGVSEHSFKTQKLLQS
ncbi:hypothetical protein WJX75_005351 [Coccomyxa subellipsoidea]|uniref:Uncharacterized protein n=1 Tax=Coccomyxa subellipsoidea TaxID=248742 RepID=A0ABR2Z3X4_9CHLO